MKKTFVKKVLEYLKEGDSSKIEKFRKENVRVIHTQINIRNDEITDINTKISEKESEFYDKALEIDLKSIQNVDDRKRYIVDYNKKLSSILDDIERLKADIETKLAEITRFKLILDLLKD